MKLKENLYNEVDKYCSSGRGNISNQLGAVILDMVHHYKYHPRYYNTHSDLLDDMTGTATIGLIHEIKRINMDKILDSDCLFSYCSIVIIQSFGKSINNV